MTNVASNRALRVLETPLRVGDSVRVKSRDEILATLDPDGRVDGLPFMPEMLAFAGHSFSVDAVVHRTCDTVKTTGTSGTTRELQRVVHLEGLRCDGSAHGGCQARCLLYWKLDWLERAPTELGGHPDDAPLEPTADEPTADVPASLMVATRRPGSTHEKALYSCQATELLAASCFAPARNPRIWLADLRSGNATIRTALFAAFILVLGKLRNMTPPLPRWTRLWTRLFWPELYVTGEKRTYPPLDLKPGELVEVRPREEIEAILDPDDPRGPRFDPGMLSRCATRARVLGRVNRVIDEKSGRMLKLRGDVVVLEGVWCDGNRQALCRRKLFTFWREAWLRRVDEGT